MAIIKICLENNSKATNQYLRYETEKFVCCKQQNSISSSHEEALKLPSPLPFPIFVVVVFVIVMIKTNNKILA